MNPQVFNKNRSSNLELLRILAMLGIVASHYNGLIMPQLMETDTPLANFLLVQSAWGKIGINCFMLISGYFMCQIDASWKKYLKLLAWVYFYIIVIQIPLIIFGKIPNTIHSWIDVLFKWKSFDMDHFVTSFLIFYLFTPFIKIFIHSLSQKQLERIILLLSIFFIGYYNTPGFNDGMGFMIQPLVWFTYLYLVAGYVRLYDNPFMRRGAYFWGGVLLIGIIMVFVSTIALHKLAIANVIEQSKIFRFSGYPNSVFAVITSFSAFMFFLKLRLPYSKIINIFGAATFGVLLIHTNCEYVYNFVFDNLLSSTEVAGIDFFNGVRLFSISIVLLFIVCALIDILRKIYIEPYILNAIYKLFKIQ